MSKLILTNEVSGVGSAGDVVEVKNGFARNYLLPQHKALLATDANKARFERERAAIEARNAKARAAAEPDATGLQLYGPVAARSRLSRFVLLAPLANSQPSKRHRLSSPRSKAPRSSLLSRLVRMVVCLVPSRPSTLLLQWRAPVSVQSTSARSRLRTPSSSLVSTKQPFVCVTTSLQPSPFRLLPQSNS